MKKQVLTSEQVRRRTIKRIISASRNTPEELLIKYDNSFKGFDEEMVEDMREQYGENIITKKEKDSIFHKLFEAFVNPFSIVLFAIAVISFFTEDISAMAIVLIMVGISGILRFVQDLKGDNAANKLTEMVETTATAMRRIEDEENERIISKKMEIPLDELVVGDIIYLAAGDMLPADVRIIQAKDLFIRQSSLTGESEPVEKFGEATDSDIKNPLELNNLAFMGSNVVSGSGIAVVLAVGDSTTLGSIAQNLNTKKTTTSFEKGINSVSWTLIRYMMIMLPVVLFINGFTKGDWMQAFLFAVSVAVGLTPEMLPMIVSTNLAKGAVSMSKKDVIVKDLNSIQNFGAMDILCTDKTGTITQDKIILEYHMNIHGESEERVLKHAFLNSYHQTGLKNLMDVAIIDSAVENNYYELWSKYHKIDEIPFDFNRRRMSVVVKDDTGKTQLITKGAIEEMLAVSKYAEYKGEVMPMTDEIKEEILEKTREFNADGLRVLGVAQKTNPNLERAFSVEDESEMVLLGYLAFLDPPKDSSAEAIATLNNYGVTVKVLTGDNDAVTRCVCKQVGIDADNILIGSDIENMSDNELKKAAENVNVFAKLSPTQKVRIVTLLREKGHVVGFLGDGINDAAAMKAADVGISVDTAVDIAKESADIILLDKDLMVLEEGVVEGRKIYANIIKYIKMTASSNFGNMLSVLVASIFLPFLPMLPIQILVLNLIYDISCITMPWDNVDKDYLLKPRKWEASSISRFMLWFGPISSIFDIASFAILFWIVCPALAFTQDGFQMLFQTGWFIVSIWTQTLVIHMLRTEKLSFIKSNAAWQVTLLTSAGVLFGTIIPWIPFGARLNMLPIGLSFLPYLLGIVVVYMLLTTVVKYFFVRRYKELL